MSPTRPPAGSRAARAPRGAGGFTLIEMVAVVLMFGLIAAFALPNLGLRSTRVLEDQARYVAADVEFARARSVMTGVPHRLIFDLEAMEWRLEWEVSESRLQLEPEPGARLDPRAPLDLSPPRSESAAWRPVPGPMGSARHADSAVFFDGIETPGGWLESGEVAVGFAPDGVSDATWIVLADDDGNTMTLEIEPLADAVGFERGHL